MYEDYQLGIHLKNQDLVGTVYDHLRQKQK